MASKRTIIKKSAKRKSVEKVRAKTIVGRVRKDGAPPHKASADLKVTFSVNRLEQKKNYPPIYTYIYEREPEDMKRIYEEYKGVQTAPRKIQRIAGFRVVGGDLVVIEKINNPEEK